ncbi:MAG: hypothetical protein JWN78_2020 [Bacteroidota bacterium]|nr:hypothetical protein [Bacteroidota bacterium]
MRTLKRNSKIRNYLFQTGALETRDETIIKKAKQQYWREYDKQLKRSKRNAKRTFTVSFQIQELDRLRSQAKYNGINIPEYIKQAVKADISNTYVIPHAHILRHIQQLLINCKQQLKTIADKDAKNWLGINKNYDATLTIIDQLGKTITTSFTQAPKISTLIEEQIEKNPEYIQELHTIINHYNDRQKP